MPDWHYCNNHQSGPEINEISQRIRQRTDQGAGVRRSVPLVDVYTLGGVEKFSASIGLGVDIFPSWLLFHSMKISLVTTLVFLILFCGCATPPNKIAASYVSPLIYKDYTDDQIIVEMDHIGRRTLELYNSLKKEASADTAQMAVGLVLFWPALFFLEGGDGPEATEYARLKGQYEALRTLAVQRNLDLRLLPPSPEEVIKENDSSKPKRKPIPHAPGG